MADLIQFNCPACGVMLRLPLSMAGSKGPCPRCARLLLAPEPLRGLGPRIQPVQTAPSLLDLREIGTVPEPLSNLVTENPAVVAPSVTVPPSSMPKDPGCQRRPHLAVFVLSLLLTAIVSLITGYLLGNRNHGNTNEALLPQHSQIPRPDNPQSDPPPKVVLVKPPADQPIVEPLPKSPDLKPQPPAKPEIHQTSVAAEAALKAFLDAPDWMTRSTYVLHSGRVRSIMETYSHRIPDGPTKFTDIKRQDAFLDQKTGTSYYVFYVFTDKHPHGIPTVVAETKSGWLVDWEAFVEFRDDQFKAFAEGPTGQSGRFHLLVSLPPSPRAANTENEYFSSFLIGPPGTDAARIAYVRKNTEAFAKLSDPLKENEVFAPVVELAKRATPDGKTFLEVTSVIAPRWLPAEAE